MLKNFVVAIFSATFFINSVAYADIEDSEDVPRLQRPFEDKNPKNKFDEIPDDEEIPKLPDEYKYPPEYAEDEKPPEINNPLIEFFR